MILSMCAAHLCDVIRKTDMDECARQLRPCLPLVHVAQAMLNRAGCIVTLLPALVLVMRYMPSDDTLPDY